MFQAKQLGCLQMQKGLIYSSQKHLRKKLNKEFIDEDPVL